MRSRRAVFRACASPEIGGGHVVRCLALARELRSRGWTCLFASDSETVASTPMVTEFDLLELPEGRPDVEPGLIAAHLGGAGSDVLIVDHYERGADFETAARAWADRIVVLEDLPNRRHNADIVLDQNGGRTAEAYDGLLPGSCKLLLGPRYALLRERFSQQAHTPHIGSGEDRIFVSMGATDPTNLSTSVVAIVRSAMPNARIDVMLTSGATHLEAVSRAIAEDPNIILHIDLVEPADIMAGALFAVGTAGINLWERCALGVPSLIHVVAENQRANAEHVASHGGGILIGDSSELDVTMFTEALRSIASDPTLVAEMAKNARRICDGEGARRVADETEALQYR